jgi:hypothetical protein
MNFWSTAIANAGWGFAIERDHDNSGADTSLGVSIIYTHVNGANIAFEACQFLNGNGTAPPFESGKWYAMVSAQSSQSGGGNIGIAPVRCPSGPFRNPMYVLVFANADFSPEATQTVNLYGANHTFLTCRPNTGFSINMNGINTNCGYAILWE